MKNEISLTCELVRADSNRFSITTLPVPLSVYPESKLLESAVVGTKLCLVSSSSKAGL